MLLPSIETLLPFFQVSGYFVVFVIFFVEGPIATYVAAFAASLGYFNPMLILLLSVLGNVGPDLVYYSIGHGFKKSSAYAYLIKRGIAQEKIEKIYKNLSKHTGKMMIAIKVVPLLPMPGLIIAGMMMPFRKFIYYSWSISAVYSLVFFFLGYYSGRLYTYFLGHFYLVEFFLVLMIIAIAVSWYTFKRYLAKEIN